MLNLTKSNIGCDTELICNNDRFSRAYQREENPHTSGHHFVNFWMMAFITFSFLTNVWYHCRVSTIRAESRIVAHLSAVRVLLFYDFSIYFSLVKFSKGWKPQKIDMTNEDPQLFINLLSSTIIRYHFYWRRLDTFLSGFVLKIGCQE